MTPSDETIARVLLETRTIAMLGASIKPSRASFRVGNFLTSVGYRVIPVNPGYAGKQLFGETVVARLADITEQVDMLDVFRRSDAVLGGVTEALDSLPGLKTVWMQIGVQNAEARALAESRGLTVIDNRCPKIEHLRLIRSGH